MRLVLQSPDLPLTSPVTEAETLLLSRVVSAEPNRNIIRYLDRVETSPAQFARMARLGWRALVRGLRVTWMYFDSAARLALLVFVAQARWQWLRWRYFTEGAFFHFLTVMQLALRRGEHWVDARAVDIGAAPGRARTLRQRLRWHWAHFRQAQRARLRRKWEDAELALHYGEYWIDVHVADASAWLAAGWAYARPRSVPRRQLLAYAAATTVTLASLMAMAVFVSAAAARGLRIERAQPTPIAPRAGLHQAEARSLAALLFLPTPTPPPTVTPSPTPEPVLTATPIPMPYSFWQSTIPWEGGWTGASECYGMVYAPLGTGSFVWPTDGHYLVGKNYSWSWHPGLDLAGPLGEPIYAADSGVVVYAGWNTYGYGNMVILDHGNGWHTLYAHFSEIDVTCGQAIVQGQVIGRAGSTGNSTGPHLHFEMRGPNGRISPWNYLP
jgi:murein DD-endopeptidase MepM/ murein hydrolase activator NlpD